MTRACLRWAVLMATLGSLLTVAGNAQAQICTDYYRFGPIYSNVHPFVDGYMEAYGDTGAAAMETQAAAPEQPSDNELDGRCVVAVIENPQEAEDVAGEAIELATAGDAAVSAAEETSIEAALEATYSSYGYYEDYCRYGHCYDSAACCPGMADSATASQCGSAVEAETSVDSSREAQLQHDHDPSVVRSTACDPQNNTHLQQSASETTGSEVNAESSEAASVCEQTFDAYSYDDYYGAGCYGCYDEYAYEAASTSVEEALAVETKAAVAGNEAVEVSSDGAYQYDYSCYKYQWYQDACPRIVDQTTAEEPSAPVDPSMPEYEVYEYDYYQPYDVRSDEQSLDAEVATDESLDVDTYEAYEVYDHDNAPVLAASTPSASVEDVAEAEQPVSDLDEQYYERYHYGRGYGYGYGYDYEYATDAVTSEPEVTEEVAEPALVDETEAADAVESTPTDREEHYYGRYPYGYGYDYGYSYSQDAEGVTAEQQAEAVTEEVAEPALVDETEAADAVESTSVESEEQYYGRYPYGYGYGYGYDYGYSYSQEAKSVSSEQQAEEVTEPAVVDETEAVDAVEATSVESEERYYGRYPYDCGYGYTDGYKHDMCHGVTPTEQADQAADAQDDAPAEVDMQTLDSLVDPEAARALQYQLETLVASVQCLLAQADVRGMLDELPRHLLAMVRESADGELSWGDANVFLFQFPLDENQEVAQPTVSDEDPWAMDGQPSSTDPISLVPSVTRDEMLQWAGAAWTQARAAWVSLAPELERIAVATLARATQLAVPATTQR